MRPNLHPRLVNGRFDAKADLEVRAVLLDHHGPCLSFAVAEPCQPMSVITGSTNAASPPALAEVEAALSRRLMP